MFSETMPSTKMGIGGLGKRLLSRAELSVSGEICLMHHQFLCFSIEETKVRIHPGKSTWNPRMEVWKMNFLFNWVIFRFRVDFPWCIMVDWETASLFLFIRISKVATTEA